MELFLDEIEDPDIKEILSYYFDLGGKRMRPTLFYAISKAFGSEENLNPFSLILELIHNMSLYHDDVLDNAEERRGAPTVHKKWDDATAIVGGDIFHGMIHKYLIDAIINNRVKSKDKSLKFISDLINDVELTIGSAVLTEMKLAKTNKMPSLELSLKVASDKTAPLFAFSASAAASLANIDQEICDKLYIMGTKMGFAFQLLDDLGDYFPSNKGLGNDLREGRKTPFIVLCHQKDNKTVEKYLAIGKELETSEILEFRNIFKEQFLEVNNWISTSLKIAEELLIVIPENEYKDNVKVIIEMLFIKNEEFKTLLNNRE